MRIERALKRALAPITGPTSRRRLITIRDHTVGLAAELRGRAQPERTDPHFLVIGAQKAGTTFLYQELLNHPEVRPTLTKELHYFDDRYTRGASWYRGHFPPKVSPETVISGEASPGYLFHPHVPKRVSRDLPDVRILVVLRDPVERAFSHWLHERRLGYEPIDSFTTAIDAEEMRTEEEIRRVTADPSYVSFAFRHFTYKARGRYEEQLRRWTAAVGANRMLVLSADKLFRDPLDTLDQVHSFLGLGRFSTAEVGRNDMHRGAEFIDSSTATELTQYFQESNRRLEEEYGIGGNW